MKLNKKGFTLIELLAVIVILAALSLVAVPGISRLINSSKKKTFVSQGQALIEAAQTQYATSDTISDGDWCISISNINLDKGSKSKSALNGKTLTGYVEGKASGTGVDKVMTWKAYLYDTEKKYEITTETSADNLTGTALGQSEAAPSITNNICP